MDRRTLLKALAAGTLAGVSGRLFAAPAEQPRCLIVFLRGAYDAASLLVPVSSDFYYAARPSIAIGRPGSGPQAAIALNTDWGLHPALRESVYPLYQQGQAVFIPFSGTDDLTRSHFETQDSIELGQGPGLAHTDHSGFLNRLSQQLQGTRTISFTEQLPIILRGSRQVANLALRQAPKQILTPRQENIIQSMYQDTALMQSVTEGFAVRNGAIGILAEADKADRQAISAKGFALEARRIARLMKEQYALGFVDVGGWDTHVSQGSASGALATKLQDFGQGLAAYAEEMGPAWRNTVVMVISEFGRTFRENGNHGTDHGHGSVYWVLGGSLQRKGIIGEQQTVSESTLFQNRDYPVLNEYRSVMGGLFSRLYGLDANRLGRIFPGVTPVDLGLV